MGWYSSNHFKSNWWASSWWVVGVGASSQRYFIIDVPEGIEDDMEAIMTVFARIL